MEFEDWYRTAQPHLVASVAVAAGDIGLAEDAVSEAFARAYARWDRVGRMASPEGWVYTVALNLVRRHERRRALERRLLRRTVPSPVVPSVVSPEVWNAVRALPQRQRTAVALRYVLDLSQAEIAELMEVAPGTVSATLAAARSRLAALLNESTAVPRETKHDPR